MKSLLFFIEDENQRGKTRRYNVYSNHSNDFLGVIRWNCAWRCYVMDYSEHIMMSIGCHKELNDFMQKLEDERKANLGKMNPLSGSTKAMLERREKEKAVKK